MSFIVMSPGSLFLTTYIRPSAPGCRSAPTLGVSLRIETSLDETVFCRAVAEINGEPDPLGIFIAILPMEYLLREYLVARLSHRARATCSRTGDSVLSSIKPPLLRAPADAGRLRGPRFFEPAQGAGREGEQGAGYSGRLRGGHSHSQHTVPIHPDPHGADRVGPPAGAS